MYQLLVFLEDASQTQHDKLFGYCELCYLLGNESTRANLG